MNKLARIIGPFGLQAQPQSALDVRRPVLVHVPTGHVGIDRSLGGGMVRGRVHEVFAVDAADASSATGFVAMLALLFGGGVVWLREEASQQRHGLNVLGLAEIGLDPARLILGLPPDPLALLCAAADVARCPGVGVAVVEIWRDPRVLDLTATRRLALAAETSGVTVLLLRIAGVPAPSAAQTRWVVQSASSLPLEANAPGRPAFDIALVRQRGRPAGLDWRVEWDRDRAVFIEPAENDQAKIESGQIESGQIQSGKQALSGAVVSFPVYRSPDSGTAGDALVAARRGTG